MKAGSLASLGGIAAIMILGAAYLAFGVVRVDPFAEHTEATMVLRNSGGLGVGSPILLTGIEVGEVTAVRATDAGVEVGFRVDGDHRLPVDSVVTIEHLSALGEPYVQFVPKAAGGPYLRDGQRLDTSDVRTPMSVAEVARLVTKTMNQLDPTVVGSLVETVSTALTGAEAVVPELARSGDLLAATIMARQPRIAELLTSFQLAAADIDWAGPATSAGAPALVRFGQALDELVEAVGRAMLTEGSPQRYLEDDGLVPFLERLTAWLREAGPEIRALLPGLQPLTGAVAEAGPQLDLSALIEQALAGTAEDAVKVRVAVR
ncbi:MlaD family protein [Nocardia farcinica]|uniref:MlaD family protein n=1 Tax=Nocardia farcinica TaxID=37329 RepID=UPI001895EC31|nr:MlaD family protein [Nocardia farcinica]MBF6269334.1 MCE family protein [Nocardia farcinica]MBF6376074.1 MCE family protein [Nocardia farcinica]